MDRCGQRHGVSKGAQGTQQEFDNIVAYLTANYGKDTPPSAAPKTAAPAPGPAPAPAPAVAPLAAPLSQAAIAKATGLIKANGCLSCHRVDNMGSYVGPDLSEIGASRPAADIQAALVSPSKDVRPENRSVRLVTKDGKTVTGRILNQTGFSVQIIDSSGQLLSVSEGQSARVHDRDCEPDALLCGEDECAGHHRTGSLSQLAEG